VSGLAFCAELRFPSWGARGRRRVVNQMVIIYLPEWYTEEAVTG
jgi:hypothetical protein